MILDTYDEAGIFALFAITVFIINVSIHVIKLLRSPKYEVDTKLIVFGLYLATYMEFMIEPVLQGLPWLFSLFCFISGVIITANKENGVKYKKIIARRSLKN